MRFYITHTRPGNPAAVVLDIRFAGANIREQAKRISRAFPGEALMVSAMCRSRLVVQDGEVVREFPDIEHFYDLSDKDPKVRAYIKHEWKELIATEFDPTDDRRKL